MTIDIMWWVNQSEKLNWEQDKKILDLLVEDFSQKLKRLIWEYDYQSNNNIEESNELCININEEINSYRENLDEILNSNWINKEKIKQTLEAKEKTLSWLDISFALENSNQLTY